MPFLCSSHDLFHHFCFCAFRCCSCMCILWNTVQVLFRGNCTLTRGLPRVWISSLCFEWGPSGKTLLIQPTFPKSFLAVYNKIISSLHIDLLLTTIHAYANWCVIFPLRLTFVISQIASGVCQHYMNHKMVLWVSTALLFLPVNFWALLDDIFKFLSF